MFLLDFFKCFGWVVVVIFIFVFIYCLSDIFMGVMVNLFYNEFGYIKIEIVNVVKLYGVILSMIGVFVGGIFVVCYGFLWLFILGVVFVLVINLVFVWLVIMNVEIVYFMLVISVDNFSVGVVGLVFIVFLFSFVS